MTPSLNELIIGAIQLAGDDLTANAKVSGAGTASAGLPG